MKYLFILLFSFNCYANDLTFNQSIINIHTTSDSKYYENKITSKGEIISNSIISITYNSFITLFVGKDSINNDMIGLIYNKRLTDSSYFVIGSYYCNVKEMTKYVNVYSIGNIIPLIGYKKQYNFINNSKIEITYTPALINISFGF